MTMPRSVTARPAGRIVAGRMPSLNLAVAYQMAGRPEEAIPLYEQVLAICELDRPDDPLTDRIRSNREAAIAAYRNRRS